MARFDPDNLARFWLDRHLRGLSLMHADFRTHAFAPHRHEGFVVAVTELGGSVIKSRGVTAQADKSALFVFNPDEPHAGWMGASRHWRYRSLYLEPGAIDGVARGLGIDAVPYFTRNLFTDPDLIGGFLSLHRALQRGCDALCERELLIAAFGTLFARHGSGGGRIEPPRRDRVRLQAALDIVHARLGETLRLDDLSDALDITQYQLIRLFKRTTGLTPHAYVTQARLDAARHHLSKGMSLSDTAAASGFYDQSALTRHFKRCYGVTPAQYARAARGREGAFAN